MKKDEENEYDIHLKNIKDNSVNIDKKENDEQNNSINKSDSNSKRNSRRNSDNFKDIINDEKNNNNNINSNFNSNNIDNDDELDFINDNNDIAILNNKYGAKSNSVLPKQMTIKGIYQSIDNLSLIQLEKEERGNFLLRQEISDLTPKWNLTCGLVFYIMVYIVLCSIGVTSLRYTSKTKKMYLNYTLCEGEKCLIEFDIEEDIQMPIYFYYYLDNFYSNHRLFVRNRNYAQTRGKTDSSNDRCQDSQYIYQIFDNDTSRYYSFNNDTIKLNETDVAIPCGYVAKTIFNGKYFT